jgi:hypothetical protein
MELDVRRQRLDAYHLSLNPMTVVQGPAYSNKLSEWRVVILCGIGVFSIAVAWIGRPQPFATVQNRRAQAVTAAPAPAQSSYQYGGMSASSSATYATRMPTGNWTNVVGSNGKFNLNAIRVAVPGPNGIQYLPGTDPAAMNYLAEEQAIHDNLTLDNGPSDIDTSELPPPNSFASQGKRVGVKPPQN